MATMQVWIYGGVETDVDMTGYDVEALDGSIGTVDDATAQARESYLVVDTGALYVRQESSPPRLSRSIVRSML